MEPPPSNKVALASLQIGFGQFIVPRTWDALETSFRNSHSRLSFKLKRLENVMHYFRDYQALFASILLSPQKS